MIVEPEAGGMDPEDELALRIGRVARAHVQIDNALRNVHQTLVSPGLGVYLVNRITSTSALVTDCRSMIAKAALTAEVESAARATLDAAGLASVTRNRVVHDMWLRDTDVAEDAPPRWLGHRLVKGQLHLDAPEPPRDLAFMDAALAEVRRTHARVSALNWALWEVLPFFQGSQVRDTAGELDVFIAVMENRFDLLDDGGIKSHVI